MDYDLADFLFRNNLSQQDKNLIGPLFQVPRSVQQTLLELYHNIEVQLKTGEYVDVLGRLYSFRENFLQYSLKLMKKYPLQSGEREHDLASHRDFLIQNPDLMAYLKSHKENDTDLRYEETNFRVLRRILDFYAKTDVLGKEIYTALNRLDEAMDYRNKTVIGHGFKGCSQAILEDKLRMKIPDIMTFLAEILRKVDIAVEQSPFDRINDSLIRRLKKSY